MAQQNYVNDPDLPSVFAWLTAPGGKNINIRFNSVAYAADGSVTPVPDKVYIRNFFPNQDYKPTIATGDNGSITLKGVGKYGTVDAVFETTVTATGTATWKVTPLVGAPASGSSPMKQQDVHIVVPA